MKSLTAIVASVSLAAAQSAQATTQKDSQNPDAAISALALKYGDYTTATHAVLRLIQTEPAHVTKWQIMLLNLYEKRSMKEAALMVSEELLHPDHKEKLTAEEYSSVRESRANLLELLVRKEDSLTAWQELFDEKPTINRCIKLSLLQRHARLYKEGLHTIETALKLAEKPAEGDITTMPVAKNSEEKMDVPVKAFLYYLKGLLLQSSDPTDISLPMAAYSQAISIAPDFPIAKNQLAALLKSNSVSK